MLCVGGDDTQSADAILVETEIFGEGTGHKKLGDQFLKDPQSLRILLKTLAKALIGEIYQGQGAPFCEDFCYGCPRVGVQIDTGRVVTTRM